jgi:hypothetical protein
VVALAHVYFEDEPGRRSAAKMSSGDEATPARESRASRAMMCSRPLGGPYGCFRS